MNTRNRNLLALGLATALLSPTAWAEKGGVGVGAGPVVRDAAQSVGPVVKDTAHDANATSNDAGEAVPPVQSATQKMVKNPTNTETTDLEKPAAPVQSQGAENAAAHSSVVTRDTFARLDTDGDGQISAQEGQVDAEFNAGFAAMDTNDDGLLTDAEYRTAAKLETGGSAQGGVNSAAHSSVAVRDTIARLDTNADGSISATEGAADAGFNGSFAAMDANSDGMVTSAEYSAWAKAQHK